MNFAAKGRFLYTPRLLNYSLFVVGMVIVWMATHDWVAMLGAFIASIHISIGVKP